MPTILIPIVSGAYKYSVDNNEWWLASYCSLSVIFLFYLFRDFYHLVSACSKYINVVLSALSSRKTIVNVNGAILDTVLSASIVLIYN